MSLQAMIHSFTGGVWSPSLYGRSDHAKYPTAVRTMKNFFPHPHGGASNRPGLEFIAEIKDSTKKARLAPFQFSVTQAYALEFGDEYMRVVKDGGLVVETAKNVEGSTQADPVVITSTAHGYVNGDYVVISGILGMTELNGKTFKVANKTTDTFELQDVDGNDIDGTTYSAYTSGGEIERIYQIVTPFAEDDINLLKFEQSADVLYPFHPSYAPCKISRTGHAAWTLTTTTFAPSISAPTGFARTSGSASGYNYVVTAIADSGEESIASSPSAGGRGDTFGWTAVTGANHYSVYEEHSGIYYYIGDAGSTSYTVASSPEIDYDTTPPQATNPFSGSGNYPGCAAFHDQRLIYGRTTNKPQSLFGSVIGSFDNMNKSSPIRDDDSFTFTLNAKMVNEIRWLVSLNYLVIGTSDSEWKASEGNNSNTITPTDINLKVQSRQGVSHVQPIVIGNTIVYLVGAGNKVRDFTYDYTKDGFDGSEISIFATHMFEGRTVVAWAYQKNPDSIIWCVMDDGSLIALTYNREQEVWGWHEHETDGKFEWVICITTDSGKDEVYFLVRRLINGTYRRYIERLSQRFYSKAKGKVTNDIQDAFFVDSGLTYDIPVEISDVSEANPVVITTSAAHGFSNGDSVDIEGIDWIPDTDENGNKEQPDQLNGNRYKVANASTYTFELTDEDDEDIDGSDFNAYIEGGYVRKAVTTISGLDHLEGCDVAVLANGSVVKGQTVENGSITLSNAASRVHVGLPYTCDLEPMEIEYQTDKGSIQGEYRDVCSVVLRLRNTREIWIGGDKEHLDEVKFRTEEDYGHPTELFTGDKQDIQIQPGSENTNRVFIRVKDPLPATILAIISRVSHGDS